MKYPRNVKIFRGQLDAAPYLGVFFLLVIFLTLSSKLVFVPGIRIDLPEVRQPLQGTVRQTVVVAVDHAGRLYYENQNVSEEELQMRLEKVIQGLAEPPALEILADKSARHEAVSRLLALAGEAGIREAYCVTRSLPLPKGAERGSSK